MPSLKTTLIRRLAVLQGIIVLGVMLIGVNGIWLYVSQSGYYEGGALDALQDAVYRGSDGSLGLDATPAMARIRRESDGFWFHIRDGNGHSLSGGQMPAVLRPALAALPIVSAMEFTGPDSSGQTVTALVKWKDTAAGRVQIFTIAHPFLTWDRLLVGASSMGLMVSLPVLALVLVVTVLVTPMVVSRAFAGLEALRRQADAINVDREGIRLSEQPVPAEVQPLVHAVNAALDRLDRGYDRQRRLLADAAHELRTPIAVLGAHVEQLPPGPGRQRLAEDASRLATLAGQLLDLQRLELQPVHFRPVELNELARRVLADIAPLAFRAGYSVDFQSEHSNLIVSGDEAALERALVNLLQNAIDHGGRRGQITLCLREEGSIEVKDEGEGVPATERDRIFEPFHRLDDGSHGAGLGLNLVRRIAEMHGATVRYQENPGRKGACFILKFRIEGTRTGVTAPNRLLDTKK